MRGLICTIFALKASLKKRLKERASKICHGFHEAASSEHLTSHNHPIPAILQDKCSYSAKLSAYWQITRQEMFSFYGKKKPQWRAKRQILPRSRSTFFFILRNAFGGSERERECLPFTLRWELPPQPNDFGQGAGEKEGEGGDHSGKSLEPAVRFSRKNGLNFRLNPKVAFRAFSRECSQGKGPHERSPTWQGGHFIPQPTETAHLPVATIFGHHGSPRWLISKRVCFSSPL
ncbi:hypothetical protein CDAR_515971 [Caerostris darwini]|uniref:Uncharacterized protein n=1 Tax=Caerostris darwini TaxID=1538125 RepID=A0AAV4NGF9_9ARAC|nr:hypothetical protein CDAR_515971 [Caerostris darwini]